MTGSGEASNGLLIINFAVRFCSFCNFPIIDTLALPQTGQQYLKIGLYQAAIDFFNGRGW